MHLVRAAQVVRREMFQTRFTLDRFHADCQKDSVTPSLLALVNMILDGANIKHQTKLANTSTQLLLLQYRSYWCSTCKACTQCGVNLSAPQARERNPTPTLLIPQDSRCDQRSRGLIDTLFSLGIVCHMIDCYSSQQTLPMVSASASTWKKLFAHPSCAKDCSLLGLSIILTITPALRQQGFFSWHRYLPNAKSITHEWRTRPWCSVIGQDISSAKSVAPLPSVYTSVPPAAMKTKHFTAPAVQRPARPPDSWLLKLPWKKSMGG
ncbi:hypothetical protein GWK47_018882 [Chionoecetes opilio]|uniref:Uncharacterized protein n=1 Tax=Chionoecetes opilio TaxID=41210 RepID=A0A8J4XZD6_CHIOP|nr:hypothetical protein GWK47_018882 [Chionoecetes opilio]